MAGYAEFVSCRHHGISKASCWTNSHSVKLTSSALTTISPVLSRGVLALLRLLYILCISHRIPPHSAVVCEWIFQLASMQRKRTVGNDFGNAGSVITEGTSASEKIVTEATDCSTCTLQSHDRYPRDSTKVSRGERWEEACGDSPIGKTTSTGGFGEETVQAEQCEGIVQVEWEGNPCCGGSRLRYP